MANEDEKPYNAADPKQVKERGQKVKDVRKEELVDLKTILDLPAGRRYIQRLLSDCGVFRTSFHPSAQIYYNEGIRSVGVKIWGEIEEVGADALILMLKEKSRHSN